MDHPDSPGGSRPPRKELQGPRPTPLKVRKDSHKIKKPPVAPPANPAQHQQVPPPHLPPRQPVIIYTVSPKVIHTHPSEFMTLVQRLTGPNATSSSSTSSSSQYSSTNFTTNTTTSSSSNIVTGFSSSTTTSTSHHLMGCVSPAARFASIEKTKMHPEGKRMMVGPNDFNRDNQRVNFHVDGTSGGEGGGGSDGMEGVERTMFFPGILSPGPGSLPPISPNLFSPFFHHDPNNNLNLQQHGNRSNMEGSYLPSPFSTNFTSPSTIFSPNSLDFLQRVLDS